jgi:sugar-specific transcriptional regulator TrmB
MEEDVQSVTGLGLTVSQAKVYLALCALEKATARRVSQHSKVARQEAYRILTELQEKGLVEKVIAVPTEFKAIPIEDGVRILIERQKAEISKHEKEAAELLHKLERITAERSLQEEKGQFVLVPEREAVALRTSKALNNALTSMDSIISWRKFLYLVLNARKFGLQKALERGVKIRIITEKPEDEKSLPEILNTFKKKYFFKVKYLLDAPSAHIALFDKKEVFINTSTTHGLTETPLLWSDSPSLIAIAHDYFETTWISAMELKPEEHSLHSYRTANNA